MTIPNCFKCTQIVEKDLVICIFCSKSFHGFQCVGLTTLQMKAINDVKGIMWCCDLCQSTATTSDHLDFQKLVLNKLDSLSSSGKSSTEFDQGDFLNRFDALVQKVTNIEKKFEEAFTEPELKRKATGLRPQTPTTSGFAMEWPKKRPLEANSKVIRGTASESVIALVGVVEELAYFHVSRFNPNADETVMKDWFMKLLNTTELESVKLTPKNISQENLSFVSFKIGVKKSISETVMNSSTWPINVMVKPFVSRPYSQKKNFVVPSPQPVQ